MKYNNKEVYKSVLLILKNNYNKISKNLNYQLELCNLKDHLLLEINLKLLWIK